ncbi:MAG: pectinesterase family protein [Bacteroidales bacterium]|nr:pectinesterase family protein [Bacteroidales bacterium]
MKSINPFILLSLILGFSLKLAVAQDVFRMTVAQDGSGDYTTVQQAIDASKSFPDQRVTIFVKNGIYKEKIVVPACNTRLSIIGESAEKTIITWGDYFNKINRGRNSTFYTYTFLVDADEFYAENLTIENSAGQVGQAVALHVDGDRCVFRNCRILGNQDTLYTDGLNCRQYFDSCYIEGTTDFIFGAATVLFTNCTIHSKRDSYITAASTTPGKTYGYVFLDCRLTAAEEARKVYLGRPWRDYARVVFIRCELGAHIQPAGWSNWQGTARDKTAYFAEYGNTGPGADTSQRVRWSHQLTKEEAAKYNVTNILSPVLPVERPVEQWIKGGEGEGDLKTAIQ